MYQNIILAYDGSLESQQALLNCKDLSQWERTEFCVIEVKDQYLQRVSL